MEPNGTELKVLPLLATRNEAKQNHHEATLAQRARVSGGPNEATVAPFPASPLRVNRAKQGQMGLGFTPPSPRSNAWPGVNKANRAKSGHRMGGLHLLATPEQPRAAEVG